MIRPRIQMTHTTRAANVRLFARRLGHFDDLYPDAANNMEISCFESAIQTSSVSVHSYETSERFNLVYSTICFVVLQNLTPSVVAAHMNDSSFPARVGTMTEVEFNGEPSSNDRRYLQLQNQEAKIEVQLTETYKCRRCNGPTSHFGLQIRSLDESQTIFIHCPKCNIRYKA